MTENIANKRLKELHSDIFEAEIYGKAYYAAVVKRNKDLNIKDDYYIRVGRKNQINPAQVNNIVSIANGINILESIKFDKNIIGKIRSNIDTSKSYSEDIVKERLSKFLPVKEIEASIFKNESTNKLSKENLITLGYSEKLSQNIIEGNVENADSGEIKLLNCNTIAINRANTLEDELTGGITISNTKSSNKGGTLGGIFKFQEDDNNYFITNAHVVTNLRNYFLCPNDKLVSHVDGIPTNSEGKRIIGEIFWYCYDDYLDMSIVKLNCKELISKNDTRCGKIKFGNIAEPQLYDLVEKCGRKTKNTEGEIISVNATVKLRNSGKYFYNQIMTTHMSLDGDSGSLLVTKNNTVGLIFAGDNEFCKVSFANNFKFIDNAEESECKPKISEIIFKSKIE